jgi:hypothetical protein
MTGGPFSVVAAECGGWRIVGSGLVTKCWGEWERRQLEEIAALMNAAWRMGRDSHLSNRPKLEYEIRQAD